MTTRASSPIPSAYKIIADYESLRAFILKLLAPVEAKHALVVPAGHSNHLHWHIGHMLFAQAGALYLWSGAPAPYGKGWMAYFGQGTGPKSYDSLVPDWDELLAVMRKHSVGLAETVGPRLSAPLGRPQNFMNIPMATVGETFPFLMAHEGEHIAHIKSLRKKILGI